MQADELLNYIKEINQRLDELQGKASYYAEDLKNYAKKLGEEAKKKYVESKNAEAKKILEDSKPIIEKECEDIKKNYEAEVERVDTLFKHNWEILKGIIKREIEKKIEG